MSDFSIEKVAEELLAARRTGTPIRPITDEYPHVTLEQAYAIQQIQVRSWETNGNVVKGYKVGLTSAAMQHQLGVNQPDFGHLLSDMFYDNGSELSIDRFISPKLEPEFAFVLKRNLRGPGVTAADAASAIEGVCGAIEIIDSRIHDWKIKLGDTVADNASSGGVLLGDVFKPFDQVHLPTEGVVLTKNGETVGTGAGAAVLGSPLSALVWLANTLGSLGVTLEKESVILPGSMTAAIAVTQDSTVTADFASFGSVTARFVAEG